jgi:hypothetical protein
MKTRQQEHCNKNTRSDRQSVVRDFTSEISGKKVLDHHSLLKKSGMPSLLR